MTELKAIKGDITKVNDVEAIVNAANITLLGGGGVDGAIHKAAGVRLFWECIQLGGCKTGKAKITSAFKLPCKYIIHTVGPIWKGGKKNEKQKLADCYKNSIELAIDKGIRRIAFPSISTGIYNFPIEQAAKIAVDEVLLVLEENPNKVDLVEWVLFDENSYRIYQQEINNHEKCQS